MVKMVKKLIFFIGNFFQQLIDGLISLYFLLKTRGQVFLGGIEHDVSGLG